ARLSAEEALRASIAAFLGFLAAEPAFARAFYIDMPAAGVRAVQRLEAAQHSFARMTRKWHERGRRENPSWPAVPDAAHLAAGGAPAQRAYSSRSVPAMSVRPRAARSTAAAPPSSANSTSRCATRVCRCTPPVPRQAAIRLRASSQCMPGLTSGAPPSAETDLG